ncbi:hypothetical protein PR048_023316 [Dryococelus australis]|uniref:Uncharacterized protein n=1 Tax=Dryococelus australis TaxID=614101 RepID=A0ABQ9GTT4_9NEOP|nr:hypothetical protein PR048_023316 [Dryococelus australis]
MEKLNSIYQQNSEFCKMTLLEKFHCLSLEPDESTIIYISKAGESVSETAIVIKILSTLPEKYRNIRQALLSTIESKQTIHNLTTRLLDEEASLTLSDERSLESALPVTRFRNKRNITCYNCRKERHIA